jgi:Bacterial Ig domain
MNLSIVAVALIAALCTSCSKSPSGETSQATSSQATSGADSSLPVLTVVDKPADGATVKNTLEVSGWVLASEGVRSVSVQLDKTVVPAQVDLPRSDVAQAYPAYHTQNPGWRVVISLADVTPGRHQLSISAETKSGKIVGIKTTTINVDR